MNAYDSPEDNTISALKDRIAELEAWQKHDLELAEATGFERAHKLQADRIAELEKENKALHELVKQRIERNVELQTLLGKYMPHTNAEPVAWWNGKEPSVLGLSYFKNDYCEIPLYTTPQDQADRIAELEKEVEDWEKATKWMEMTRQVPEKTNVEPTAYWDGKHFASKEKSSLADIPLYTTPQTELNAGGEPVKNATYWKRQYNEMSATNDRLKSSLYHANEQIKYLEATPQTKPLSDDEALKLVSEKLHYSEYKQGIELIRAIEERILNHGNG